MKTIFYRQSTKDNPDDGDYFFFDQPYDEWFTLEGILYNTDSGVSRYSIEEGTRRVKDITVLKTTDVFSDNGIIRRVALVFRG